MAHSAVLSLALLGPPEVRVHGKRARFRSRKELALLAYLTVMEGQHIRDMLTALLWPESDRKLGQAALRNTLTRIRHALGVASPYLRVEPGTISLDTDGPVDLDVRVVEAACHGDLARTQTGQSDEMAALQRATGIYRGDFLEGFSLADAPDFDDWASRQREHLYEQMERIFDRLSGLQCDRGEVEDAVGVARRWIGHNSLSEPAYRRLMRAHSLSGNRAAALHTFELCREVLARELGVAPDAETEELAQRIRSSASPIAAAEVRAAVSLVPELPFVGREVEHRALVSAFRDAAGGEPRCVCVVGEAGIGKTRLTQTFLRWAGDQVADILMGRAIETRGLPYQPLVAAIRARLAREPAPALGDVWLVELTRLLPELRERYPHLSPPAQSDPALGASHLFEAVAQVGEALARESPIVLWIDDIQWADAGTLDLLLYLCSQWVDRGVRLLLLLCARGEADAPAPEMREWLVKLEREIMLTRLHLAPLTAGAMRQMAHALADPWATQHGAADRFSDWLFAETGGQPYFAAETVKMLVEREAIHVTAQGKGLWMVDFVSTIQRLAGPDQIPTPASVRDVIVTRLERLSEEARALLVAAATLGRTCSFKRLCQVAGVEEMSGLPALEEALGSRLLVAAADNVHRYTFAHDKIRHVVYAEAGPERRRTYHHRAFEVLRDDNAPAAELAHHAMAGGLFEPAYEYSVVAGDQASSVYAHVEAAKHYRRAIDVALASRETDSTCLGGRHEDLLRLYRRQGRALELASQYEEALAVYRDMEDIAMRRSDRALELAAVLAQIVPLATVTAVFDPAGAERLADRALDLALDLGDRASEIEVLWSQLVIYRYINELSRATVCGERALELVRELGSHERLPYVFHDLGYCYAFGGQAEEARTLFSEAAKLWRDLGNLPMLADSLTGACTSCVFDGAYSDAIALFEEGLRIADTTGSPWARAGCRHNVGHAFAQRGEVARAIDEMREGIHLSEEVTFLSPLVMVPTDLARLYGALGALEQAMELVQMAVETAEKQVPILRLYPLSVLVHLCLVKSRFAQAESVVKQMQTDPHRDAVGIFDTLLLQAEAELALAHGRHSQAAAMAKDAAIAARARGARAFLPAALDLEARSWLGLRESGAARARWRAAIGEAERQGARLQLWTMLLELSKIEPDVAAARELHKRARDAVQYIADQAPPDLCQSFLRVVQTQETTRTRLHLTPGP